MDIHSYGPENVSYDIVIPLGQSSNLRDYPDSLFKSVYSKSGRDEISVWATTGTIPFSADSKLHQYKERIRAQYPGSMIEDLNGLLDVDFKVENNIHRLSLSGKKRYSKQSITKIEDSQISPKVYQIFDLDSSATAYAFKGSMHVCYKDTLSGGICITAPHFNSKRFLYNDSVWSFNDISQAYIGIKLNGSKTVYTNNGIGGGNGLFRGMDTKITIDFAAPVEFSSMNPEPDVTTMTGLVFKDPDKITRIAAEGLFFHVGYLENENIQSMKMFVLTAAITALATLIISLIYKLIRFSRHRKNRLAEKD